MKSSTFNVSLGEHFKMTVLISQRERVQRFFRDVLGCQVTINPKIDMIRLGDNFNIGVVYEDSALNESDFLKAIWMELRTDNPEELKFQILKFGIKELEYRDKKHFYFQAPGGQVFRLADSKEDMSRLER